MKYVAASVLVVVAIILTYSTASEVIQTFGLDTRVAALLSSQAVRNVTAKAQECADALIASDYERLINFTHPRIVEGMGGKEKAIERIAASSKQMSSQGVGFLSVKIGIAEEPRMVGNLMISLVPETLQMQSPKGTLIQESSLLGISSDKGATWFFLDVGPVTEEQLGEIFPELAGEVTLPPKKYPTLQ